MITRSQIYCGRAKRIDGNLILGTVVLSGIIPRSFPGPFMDVKYVLEHACPAKWFHGSRSVLKKHVQAKAWVAESGLHKIQIMTVLPKDSLICFSIQGLGSSAKSKHSTSLEQCHHLNRAEEQEGKLNKSMLLGLICIHVLCITAGKRGWKVHSSQNKEEQIRKHSPELGQIRLT